VNELLDALSKHGSLLARLIVALGVLITWSYCAFTINFFPTGLNIADGLVFVFIALGFGLLYLLWLMTGVLLYYFGQVFLDEPLSWGSLLPVATVILLLGCHAGVAYELGSFPALVAPLSSGFLLHFALFKWKPVPGLGVAKRRERRRFRITLIFMGIMLPPFIAVPILSIIINSAFSFIGIQQKNVSLVLDADNLHIINDVAKELDLSVYGCSVGATPTRIVHHFNVLWHGLGERSLVQLLVNENGNWVAKAKIELDQAGLKIITPTDKKASFSTCVTLNTDTLFDNYSDTPNDEGKVELKNFAERTGARLKEAHLAILSARIIGYTDRVPIAKDNDSNTKLSIRRAKQVFTQLAPLFDHVHVDIVGRGSLEPKATCPWDLKGLDLRECLAIDRRVEIELKLQQSAEDKKTGT